jgi:hypothetical protein
MVGEYKVLPTYIGITEEGEYNKVLSQLKLSNGGHSIALQYPGCLLPGKTDMARQALVLMDAQQMPDYDICINTMPEVASLSAMYPVCPPRLCW